MSTPTRPEHPDDEVLADLALGGGAAGEPDDVPATDRRHVEGCARCTAELDELRRTVRLACAVPPDAAPRPGAGVWAAVAAGVRADAADDDAADDDAPAPLGRAPVPHLDHRREDRRRRAVPLRAAAALAAACLVVGGLAGRLLAPDVEPADPVATSPVVVELASGELDAVGDGHRVGTATVLRAGAQTALSLTLSQLDPRGGYLEVWMLDRELDQMVSVGVVGDSGTPSFTIPERLLQDGYVVIDVSRQSFTGGPEHSGDSLVRGTLTT